ncbi:Conserved hypothetical protein [Yarrowia lipolytica]|nr:Conserved hypothetical protein [Yarrowia lipolytica]
MLALSLQETVTALLLLFLTTYIIYSLIPSARDAHPLVVLQQSNLGSIRQPGESGVYRSHFCPHGLPLLRGLQIQADNYRLRNGNMGDLLELASDTVSYQNVRKLGSFLKPNVTIIWDKNKPEFVEILFACALYNLSVVVISDEYTGEALKEAIKVSNPGILVKNGEFGVLLNDTSYETVKNTYSEEEFPALDESYGFLGFPVSDIHRKIAIKYYNHANIVAAIVGQLKGFPATHEVTQKDTVYFADASIGKPFPLVLYLATLAIGAGVVTELDQATIVVTTQDRVSRLLSTKLSLWQRFKLSRAESSLANGCLNRSGVLTEYSKCRMLFFAAQEPALTSVQVGKIRALTGSHIVYSLMSRECLSPVAQTNIYDYRLINGVVFGPPPPCLEGKVQSESDDKVTKGQLVIQSPAADKGWLETEYFGEWGADGAWRLKSYST